MLISSCIKFIYDHCVDANMMKLHCVSKNKLFAIIKYVIIDGGQCDAILTLVYLIVIFFKKLCAGGSAFIVIKGESKYSFVVFSVMGNTYIF